MGSNRFIPAAPASISRGTVESCVLTLITGVSSSENIVSDLQPENSRGPRSVRNGAALASCCSAQKGVGPMVGIKRRQFIRQLASVPVLAWVVGLSRAYPETRWVARRATPDDVDALVVVFNNHLKAGTCPYAERSVGWTPNRARAFLRMYQATIVLRRGATPVGFVGLIDYNAPGTTAKIAPGADTDIPVVALDLSALGSEAVVAAKHLAAAAGRELRRQGIPGCRLMIRPKPIFGSQEWFERHMAVERQLSNDGIAEALEIRLDAIAGLRDLESAGF